MSKDTVLSIVSLQGTELVVTVENGGVNTLAVFCGLGLGTTK